MRKAKCSFKRDNRVNALSSTNSVSTDALRALEMWVGSWCRSYEILEDSDDEVIASLEIDPHDQLAGAQLDIKCSENGVNFTFIGEIR